MERIKLMRRSLIIFIVGIMFFTVGLFAQAQEGGEPLATGPQLTVSLDANDVFAGNTFTATINVAEAQGVYGTNFKLNYDPALFEVISTDGVAVTQGAFFADQPGFSLRNVADPTTGIVEYAMTLMQPAVPLDGDGVVGTVTFRALQDGVATVSLSEAAFVVPEFTEVEGQMVAQTVNQVTARIENAAPLAPVEPLVAEAVVEQPQLRDMIAEGPAGDAAREMFDNPGLAPATSATGNQIVIQLPDLASVLTTDRLVSLMAVGLLLIGVALLMISVSMYSRMRTRYAEV
jgi:hypothetical protein